MAVSDYFTSASLNVSISGINIGEGMARSDVNNAIRQQMADTRAFWDQFAGKDYGALPAGVNELWFRNALFSGAAAGATTRVDSVKFFHELDGTNSVGEVRGFESGNNLYHSGSTVGDNYAGLFYNRVGLNGTLNGTVTTLRGVDSHNAVEGTGNVTLAMSFNASAVDLLQGTGTIATNYAYRADDMGHATRVTGTACAFVAEDQTAGAALTLGFQCKMTTGTNKWGFYAPSTVKHALVGALRLGDTTVPSDKLEVKGYAKLTSDGTITTAAGYHEITNDGSGFVAVAKSKHASTPNGLQISFSAAAPNNTTQLFLNCADSSTTRLSIQSNGNVVNVTGTYGVISDRRLKKNIRNAGSQLADIRALKLRKYQLKSDGKNAKDMLGVIAQEVEKVSPGLILEDEEGTKGVNTSILYMKALGALQELAAIVEKQGKEIAALKAKK